MAVKMIDLVQYIMDIYGKSIETNLKDNHNVVTPGTHKDAVTKHTINQKL